MVDPDREGVGGRRDRDRAVDAHFRPLRLVGQRRRLRGEVLRRVLPDLAPSPRATVANQIQLVPGAPERRARERPLVGVRGGHGASREARATTAEPSLPTGGRRTRERCGATVSSGRVRARVPLGDGRRVSRRCGAACFLPRHPGFRQLPFLGRPAERHCVEKRKKLFFLTSSLRLALRFGSLSRPPRAALSTPPPTSLSRRTRMSRMSRPLRPEPSVLFLFATCGASRWPASSAARPTEKRRRRRTRRDVF